jgi:adenosylhomocysteine nucleosidase
MGRVMSAALTGHAGLTVLTGLADEAAIVTGARPWMRPAGQGAGAPLVLCGSAQRDALAQLVPAGCRGLVSFGVCGGLVRGVAFGDILVAASVSTSRGSFLSDQAWSARLLVRLKPARLAPFYSDPAESAATPAQRQALAARTGAWAVDQETCAVAELAAARALPWVAIRSPSDLCNETVIAAARNATNADGSPDIPAVVGDVLARPADLPGFLQDADGYGRALAALRAAYRALGPDFAFEA